MFLDELARVLRLNIPADQKIKLARKEMQRIILAEEELERERIIALRTRYGGQAGKEEANINWFSDEERIELTNANTNKLIWDRPFKSLGITELKPLPGDTYVPQAYIRLNNIASSIYQIRTGFIKGDFDKIYLTNVAQAGAWFKFVISTHKDTEFRMLGEADKVLEQIMGIKGLATHKTLSDLWNQGTEKLKEATTPTTYNVNVTLADTEYSQVLPVVTKIVKAVLADGATFRLAWVAGKVATPTVPYWTQPANIPFELQGLSFSSKTLYFASPGASKVMQIEAVV